jgi:hypothetical protein
MDISSTDDDSFDYDNNRHNNKNNDNNNVNNGNNYDDNNNCNNNQNNNTSVPFPAIHQKNYNNDNNHNHDIDNDKSDSIRKMIIDNDERKLYIQELLDSNKGGPKSPYPYYNNQENNILKAIKLVPKPLFWDRVLTVRTYLYIYLYRQMCVCMYV